MYFINPESAECSVCSIADPEQQQKMFRFDIKFMSYDKW